MGLCCWFRTLRPATPQHAAGRLAGLAGAALLLTGCDTKKIACEEALKIKLKNPKEYKMIEIKEDYGEGKAFNMYHMKFSYYKGKIIRGNESCLYDNNDEKAYIDIPYPLISQ